MFFVDDDKIHYPKTHNIQLSFLFFLKGLSFSHFIYWSSDEWNKRKGERFVHQTKEKKFSQSIQPTVKLLTNIIIRCISREKFPKKILFSKQTLVDWIVVFYWRICEKNTFQNQKKQQQKNKFFFHFSFLFYIFRFFSKIFQNIHSTNIYDSHCICISHFKKKRFHIEFYLIFSFSASFFPFIYLLDFVFLFLLLIFRLYFQFWP